MTRLTISFTAALLGGLAIAGIAHASSCDAPDPPGCATDRGRFDDLGDFEDCRRQMGRYGANVRAHLDCVRDEFASTSLRFESRSHR